MAGSICRCSGSFDRIQRTKTSSSRRRSRMRSGILRIRIRARGVTSWISGRSKKSSKQGAANMPGAMDGVRILDLSTMVAGPVATMMLADQGADVIKVESPHGDLMRHFSRGRNGMNASFLSCNRNKRSIAVDLKSAGGLEILKKLIATAQALV